MTASATHMTTPPATNNPPSSSQQKVEPCEVGWLFVQEYYTILNKDPSRLHCFYNKRSNMSHGLEGEQVKIHCGQQDIHKKFIELDFQDSKVLISSVDTQPSLNGSVIVQVLGELSVKGGSPSHKFVQTFFLAEQVNGYYVLNDIFRYLKEDIEEHYAEDLEEASAAKEHQHEIADQLETPLEPERAVSPQIELKEEIHVEKPKEHKVSPKKPSTSPEQQQRPASPTRQPAEARKEAWKTPVAASAPKAATEQKSSEKSAEGGKAQNESTSSSTPAPKTWANITANDSSKWGKGSSESKAQAGVVPAPAKATAPAAEVPLPAVKPTSDPSASVQGQSQSQGYNNRRNDKSSYIQKDGIYIKNLHPSISEEQLFDAFSKLGVVSFVEVHRNRNSAYVDFANAETVQLAISTPVTISGKLLQVEEKRKNHRNMRRQSFDRRPTDRPRPPGRGGHRGGHSNSYRKENRPQSQQGSHPTQQQSK